MNFLILGPNIFVIDEADLKIIERCIIKVFGMIVSLFIGVEFNRFMFISSNFLKIYVHEDAQILTPLYRISMYMYNVNRQLILERVERLDMLSSVMSKILL